MANLFGPVLSAFGVNAAGDEERKYLNSAADRLKTGYGAATGAQQPIYDTAMGGYKNLMSKYAGGGFDPNNFNFQADPGYNFTKQQGMDAINARAGAEGMGHSPQTDKALGQYVTGLANQTYNNAWNRNYMGDQANFSQGMQLSNPLFHSADMLSSLNTGLGENLANIETQKGGISGQLAALPWMAGAGGLESLDQTRNQMFSQLMPFLGGGGAGGGGQGGPLIPGMTPGASPAMAGGNDMDPRLAMLYGATV